MNKTAAILCVIATLLGIISSIIGGIIWAKNQVDTSILQSELRLSGKIDDSECKVSLLMNELSQEILIIKSQRQKWITKRTIKSLTDVVVLEQFKNTLINLDNMIDKATVKIEKIVEDRKDPMFDCLEDSE